MMPAGTPMSTDRSMPPTASVNVTGNRVAIPEATLWPGLNNDSPEVPVDDPVEPAQVLPVEGLVEVELAGDLGDLGRRGVDAPGERQGRVARQDQHEAEDGEGDEEQERDGDEQPADDEREQRTTRSHRRLSSLLRGQRCGASSLLDVDAGQVRPALADGRDHLASDH